jgi:hypothetical protein
MNTGVNEQDRRLLFGASSRFQVVLLAIIFLLGLGIRLYDLKDPPLDFHPVRQLRSALIARSVYYSLNPAADPALRQVAMDTSSLEIYEPPILEQMVGLTYRLVGSEQVWISRIYTSLCWLIGGLALLGLARRYFSFDTILVGLGFYFFLPFSVIASRSFQPDPWMVMWVLLFAYALNRWQAAPTWKWAVISGVLGGMAVLVKVFAGFYVTGMLAAVVLTELGWRRFWRSRQVWLMAGLVVVPAAVYYLFILQDRSSGFFSFWTLRLGKMVFTSSFYADWLAMVGGLMGLTIFMAALLGVLFLAASRLKPLLMGFWIGYGAFGLFSPYQYTTHEYYHLGLVPLVALSILPLLEVIFRQMAQQARLWRWLAVAVLLFYAGYSLWVARSVLYARNYNNEATAWRRMGEAIPLNRSIIALTGDYGMRLRYFGWRTPSAYWPAAADLNLSALSGNSPMDYAEYFKQATTGKEFFLVTAFTELDAQPQLKAILSGYPIYEQGDGFVMYDLTKPLSQ